MDLRRDPSLSRTSASFKSILKDGMEFYLTYTASKRRTLQ